MLSLLLDIGAAEHELPKPRKRRRYLILMALLMAMGGILWGSISLANGFYLISAVPFGYVGFTILNLSLLQATQELKVVKFMQMALSIALPFVFQWMLGGFHASGAIGLWALVAVAASFTFHDASACWKWLGFYLTLLAVSGWQDAYFDAHTVTHTDNVRTLFYTINIGMVSATAFGMMFFFKSSSDNAQAELEEAFKELQVREEEIRQNLEEITIINERLVQSQEKLQQSFDMERQARESLEIKDMELYKTVSELKKKDHENRAQAEQLTEANNNLQHQFMLIRSQNETIELWNQKITQNIHYARRIQQALMCSAEALAEAFPESFVIEQPKDIVGGDFYWMQKMGSLHVLVVADCTGHGVSGALMSIVCISLLNEAVRMQGNISPSDILRHLDQRLREVIAQQQLGESQVNDGMDAAVLAIDLEARSLEFAGAHSSCYLMRKGQIQELKGSPCPVGGFQRGREARRYESHFVALEPNDILYACSDGFKDQFGGPHNRKLLGKTVRQWLEDMAQHPMTLQKELLWKSWLLWKGRQKQTDDVLLAGVKIGHEHFRKQA